MESSPWRRSVSDKEVNCSWIGTKLKNTIKSNYKSLVKKGISAEDAAEWIEADDFELINSIAFIIAENDNTNISGI